MICSSESRCKSFNFRLKDKSCELNDANKHTHPRDFGPKEGSVYMNKDDEFKSCSEILDRRPRAESGYYGINIGNRNAQVYCDMEKHGGGWTLVVSISSQNNDHLQSAANNCLNLSLCVPFTDQHQGRKLSDSDIHELAGTEDTQWTKQIQLIMPSREADRGHEIVDLGSYTMNSKGKGGSRSQVQLYVEDKQVTTDVDAGSAASIIYEIRSNNLFRNLTMKPTNLQLRTYPGELLSFLESFRVSVKYQTQEAQLPLFVAKGDKPLHLGRNWLKKLRLNWSNIFKVTEENVVHDNVSRYTILFASGYGNLK
ncbi:hypothetical protein AWC38_SpisGene10976 [Stylophora pistillata]|uniref:Fibrinogen C-terminal domain-containing protein n=1 Tax=Stylophora pistillata TaxID=50429 RepID=A0A2B4S5V1_STYPI|nr:hypothetical protein AWC38_SpisGene10976 [Stylophora pistillata]